MTFRHPVHPEAADKRFRVWVSLINRELYGVRWARHGDGIWWARALEWQRRDVVHYHALLGGAGLDALRRLSWMDAWTELAGWARIEPPRAGDAVRGYVSKYVVKDDAGGELDLGGRLSLSAAELEQTHLELVIAAGASPLETCS